MAHRAFLILSAIFVLGSTFNAIMILMVLMRKTRSSAMLPLCPGIAGVVSFYLSPYPELWHYLWLPLVIDPGCAFCIVMVIAAILPDAYATNRFFEVARLRSHDCGEMSVLIRLYSSGKYILKMETNHRRTILSHISEWSIDDSVLRLVVGSKPVEYSIVRESSSQSGAATKLHWLASSAPSVLDGVNLEQISGRGL